jgi:hypothetical protein
MLQEATEDPPSWLIVVGHYPIYSAGSHGDMSELSTYLLPLLIKYKVHAYVSGHDHISEHLRRDGIEYFVAGAGSMTDQLKYSSQADLVWSGVGYSAYASMEASVKELTMTYRDWNNTVRYSYTLTNPMYVPPIKPPAPGPIVPIEGDHGDHVEGSSGDSGDENVDINSVLNEDEGIDYNPAFVAAGSLVFLGCTGLLVYLYLHRTMKYSQQKQKNIKHDITYEKILSSMKMPPPSPSPSPRKFPSPIGTTYNKLAVQNPDNALEEGLAVNAIEQWKLGKSENHSNQSQLQSSLITAATTGSNTPTSSPVVRQLLRQPRQSIYANQHSSSISSASSSSDSDSPDPSPRGRTTNRYKNKYMSL